MTDRPKRELSEEVHSRLDALFDNDDAFSDEPDSESPASKEETAPVKSSPDKAASDAQSADPEAVLLDLSAIILSLDWEITDSILTRLNEEIENLKKQFQDKKLPYLFLQLLGSVGKYISAKKANAHPDSVRLLHSVFAGLKRVVTHPDLSEIEKKRILSAEVKQFIRLKQQILASKKSDPRKTVPTPEPAPSPASKGTAAVGAESGPDWQQKILQTIRQTIREEFDALRKQLGQ